MLVGTITTLSYNSIQNAKKTVFALEISSIQEAVDKYLSDSVLGEYPTIGNEYLINISGVSSAASSQFDGENTNINNEITVYEVDLSILGITDTVYGNKNTDKDVYVLSKATGRVYYLEGIKLKSTTYYTLTEDLLELKDKKEKVVEETSTEKPYIYTDGYVANTLADGSKEVYLTNIRVTNNPKIFKYEFGKISEDVAEEYFKTNGKTVTSDRIKLEDKISVTLYAENSNGEYDIEYCIFPKDNVLLALTAGLKVGDVVSYTVTSKTATSVSTKNGYQDQTIENKTDFVWRYIGVNDDGEALIAPDITSDLEKFYLQSRLGYLNGPDELNRICNEMYSVTGVGEARSMNIEDVIRLLGYRGEKGAYYDKSGDYTPTAKAKTISTIASEIDYDMEKNEFGTAVPKTGKTIGEYNSDFYFIYKEEDIKKMKHPENKKYVYYSTYYWLASQCVDAFFSRNLAYYRVRCVYSNAVYAENLYYSSKSGRRSGWPLRPVVCVNSNVQFEKISNNNWELK